MEKIVRFPGCEDIPLTDDEAKRKDIEAIVSLLDAYKEEAVSGRLSCIAICGETFDGDIVRQLSHAPATWGLYGAAVTMSEEIKAALIEGSGSDEECGAG